MSILSKKCLGIDIGAASIKVVEVSGFGKKKKLENYLEFNLPVDKTSIKTFHGENLILLSEKVSEILEALLKKAGIKERRAAFSLPDFSTFFTTFSLPPMTEKEIPQAIEFEARHHIPLPLSEVSFDWRIIERKEVLPGVKLKILLVAVPNRVLENYQKMVNLIKVRLKGMEAEVFGLIRTSIPKELSKKPVCLIDIGWQSTNISIVEDKSLLRNHSFDISDNNLTRALSSALNVDLEKAKEIKKKYGLDPKKEEIVKALLPEINLLASEVEKVCRDFYQTEGKEITDIVLAGGVASLFGLKEYLESRIKKKVQIVDPFSSVSFPAILKPRLKELGPSLAVALGVAIMGLES